MSLCSFYSLPQFFFWILQTIPNDQLKVVMSSVFSFPCYVFSFLQPNHLTSPFSTLLISAFQVQSIIFTFWIFKSDFCNSITPLFHWEHGSLKSSVLFFFLYTSIVTYQNCSDCFYGNCQGDLKIHMEMRWTQNSLNNLGEKNEQSWKACISPFQNLLQSCNNQDSMELTYVYRSDMSDSRL